MHQRIRHIGKCAISVADILVHSLNALCDFDSHDLGNPKIASTTPHAQCKTEASLHK